MNGSTGTVGLSKHASDMLGEIVYVELPDVGRKVVQFGTDLRISCSIAILLQANVRPWRV